MHPSSLRARRGFTLIEIMISMTLVLAVIGMSTQLFRRQSNAVSTQAGTLDATQNSRFALSNLDRELRMTGGGVVDRQPMLVMAGLTSIVFNANLVAVDTGDYAAVYYNPDADSAAAGVFRHQYKLPLPGSSTQYPESTYTQNGLPSSAETIAYWLSRDSTSTRTDEYILFRRVNARTPRIVARNIVYNTGDTVFQYFRADSTGTLLPVATSALPLIHNAAIHGSPVDTGRGAWTDSIRQVRARFKSRYYDPRAQKNVERTLELRVKLMNAGLIRYSTCGNPPLSVAATATAVAANGTTVLTPYVRIRWTPSIDERTGERDVERYAIYRRLSSVVNFDEPFASIPASGDTAYFFNDMDVIPGQSWVYGIAAQDCTPLLSSAGQTGAVTVP